MRFPDQVEGVDGVPGQRRALEAVEALYRRDAGRALALLVTGKSDSLLRSMTRFHMLKAREPAAPDDVAAVIAELRAGLDAGG